MRKEIIHQLLKRYIQGQLSRQEKEDLLHAIDSDEEGVVEVLKKIGADNTGERSFVDAEAMSRTLQRVLATDKPGRIAVKSIQNRKIWWSVAATIVLLVGIAVGFKYLPGGKPVIPQKLVVTMPIPAPQQSKATITLANGNVIFLDSLSQGLVAEQSDAKVMKLDSEEISYQLTDDGGPKSLRFNTLSNPRGSRVINLRLTDGSRVWLNAGSSLRYPVTFPGDERQVTLTGEAYFEVAANPQKPFQVIADGLKVTVLGTHFNINAYADEDAIRTTLLEGKVTVSAAGHSKTLIPGDQAQWSRTRGINIMKPENPQQAVAWKNGFFSFQNSTLREIMRQLSRWYDIDVVYEENIPVRKFGGIVSRQSTLDEVLTILEESNVHFKINGKQITVHK